MVPLTTPPFNSNAPVIIRYSCSIRIETLIDDALASGDKDCMQDTLKRL